ncbi:ATP-binding protein [Roseovarius sp. EGI FJ00037]|uniref:ATP-binding protein n=2 Tax=Roseovarius TaxID=74030 RepID=UPI0022A80A16|nr:ATP-binding protein [Roseovarius sp. EGI FJ00037]MCZ0810984.1 ATP-binding protein [Roseovarius sp. EGI FJ00037]
MPLRRAASDIRPRIGAILAAALIFAATGGIVGAGLAQMVIWLVAGTLAMTAGWIVLLSLIHSRADHIQQARIAQLLEHDPTPSLVAAADGALAHFNPAAKRQLDTGGASTLAGAFQGTLANPGAILFRLESRARVRGAAREAVITRQGHMHVSVHRVGPETYLWRIEKPLGGVQIHADPMPLPLMTVGRNDTILFMNAAARNLVGERVRTLDEIFSRLQPRPGQVNDIISRTGPMPCLLVELEASAGRRELFLLPGIATPERQPDGWAFFDELPVPLLKLAPSGEIELSNRPARDLLGVAACQDRRLGDLLEGLGRSITDWLEDAAAGRGGGHSEFMRVRRDDKEVFAQVTLNRVSEAGKTVLIAVLSDATKLKSLEAQFVQSQKMQAIGQLAGGVAHDFNNLLTAITGHCDLALLRHDQGDADYADLVQISQNANRAAALVSQLLAYSRKQTLRPEMMDMRDMLADLTHLLNRLVGEKVMLALSHDPMLFKIRADKRQLEQVLMNLVVNARDAMPEGGDIRIVTENLDLAQPMRRGRAVVPVGRYVSVRVIDEGVGIPADKLQKVFEPFVTTKRPGEGTGLGLSTAYGIIKQTGGFIFVDSVVGAGTTFQLLLPANDAPEEPLEVPETSVAGKTRADGVVLLVEDEAPVRAFASRALQLRGYTVLEAESGEDALKMLKDPELKVDVFVSDVVMPGLDGPGWVSQALKHRPDVHVVFVSGYAEETFGDAQKAIPNSVFLPKPFSLTELTETVQRQMG